MQACIVGHGPSMLTKQQGFKINQHDKVVRLKDSKNLVLRPEYFGSKTDIVCGSLVVGARLTGEWSDEYWLFVDTRTAHIPQSELDEVIKKFLPNQCHIDRYTCLYWVEQYKRIRNKIKLDRRQELKGPLSDEKGHLHCSAGMFSIIYALSHLKPDELVLYGFDNIYNGTFNWSVTRGMEWRKYPDHNWQAESRMIYDVCKHYGYELKKQDGLICISAT